MKIAELTEKMIAFSNGNIHDIDHFIRVWAQPRKSSPNPILVGHHHTFRNIDGADYQILVEADYMANASEKGYSKHNIDNFAEKFIKTAAGKRLAKEALERNE